MKKYFADWEASRFRTWMNWGFKFMGLNEDNITLINDIYKLEKEVEKKSAFTNHIINKLAEQNDKYFVIAHYTDIQPNSNEIESWLTNKGLYLLLISATPNENYFGNDILKLQNDHFKCYPKVSMNTCFKGKLDRIIKKIEQAR